MSSQITLQHGWTFTSLLEAVLCGVAHVSGRQILPVIRLIRVERVGAMMSQKIVCVSTGNAGRLCDHAPVPTSKSC